MNNRHECASVDSIERVGDGVTHIHARRPQTNGHVEALQKTILDECWRPAKMEAR